MYISTHEIIHFNVNFDSLTSKIYAFHHPSYIYICAFVYTCKYVFFYVFNKIRFTYHSFLASVTLSLHYTFSLVVFVIDCKNCQNPLFLSACSLQYNFSDSSINNYDLFFLLLNLDWPCNVFWSIKYSVPVESLGCKQLCVSMSWNSFLYHINLQRLVH